MVRVIALCAALCGAVAVAEELSNGLITASQVDVTADDGSLLPDRLNVGDIVYIVTKPTGGKRNGWVRVSKSPDDKSGYGWIEQKYIRTFSNYKDLSGGATAGPSFPAPTPSAAPISDPNIPTGGATDPALDGIPFATEESFAAPAPAAAKTAAKYKKVGLLRFLAQANDAFVASSYETFSAALGSAGLAVTPLTDAVKSDSEAALQKLVDRAKLDGVFVGNVSDPLDDGRLVQVKFYSAKDKKFVVEKVTRVPLSGSPAGMIQNFAQSIVDQLNNPL